MSQSQEDGREAVKIVRTHWDAKVLQGFLESNGVSAWVRSAMRGDVLDAALALGGHEILVLSRDVPFARELIATGGMDLLETDADLARTRLEALLMQLLELPCTTGREEPIADWIADRYLDAGEELARVGNSLVVGRLDDERPTVLLVGHLDVVPPTDDDRKPHMTDEAIVGRGASDMKGGLAVALDCFDDLDLRSGPYNIVVVAYAGEEGAADENELPRLLEALPELGLAELAVVLEPTDLTVQLGCLGGLHAELTVTGTAAHSARPWYGDNALTKAGTLLRELHQRPPERVSVEGLDFYEVLTPTQAWTANARNVVPDRFTVNLNYRFAPHRTLEEAERELLHLLSEQARVVVVDRVPPAAPRRDDPVVAAFVEAVDAPVEAKQAWTDVARFAAEDVPALNYGPGLAAQAHQRGEWITRDHLVTAREGLARFLSAGQVRPLEAGTAGRQAAAAARRADAERADAEGTVEGEATGLEAASDRPAGQGRNRR